MKCFIVLVAVLALSQAKSFNKGKFEKTEDSDLSFGHHFDAEAFNGWYGKQQEFTWEKPNEQAIEFYHYLLHFGVSQEHAVAIVEKVFHLPAASFVKDATFETPEGKYNFFDKFYWQQKGQFHQVYQVLEFLRQHGVIGEEAFNYFYQYYQPEGFFGKNQEYQPFGKYYKQEQMPFFYGKHQSYAPFFNKYFYGKQQGFQPFFYKQSARQEFYGPYNTQFYHQYPEFYQQYQHQYPMVYNKQYQHETPEFYQKYQHQYPMVYNKQYQHETPEFYQKYQHQYPEFQGQYQPEFYQKYQHQYPMTYNKQYQHETPEFYQKYQHQYPEFQGQYQHQKPEFYQKYQYQQYQPEFQGQYQHQEFQGQHQYQPEFYQQHKY